MGIVLKVIGVILVIGILATVIGVGINAADYMFTQKFDFGKAVSWGWDSYIDWLNKNVNPFKANNTDMIEYPMVNQHVDVVACTDLQ